MEGGGNLRRGRRGEETIKDGKALLAWRSMRLILFPFHTSQLMLQEQDQGLEELGTAVDRVGRMADAMNQELNAQNRMLGDLEVEVENTNEQMNFVMGRLSKLLKTKGKFELGKTGGGVGGEVLGMSFKMTHFIDSNCIFIFILNFLACTHAHTQTSTSCGSSSF